MDLAAAKQYCIDKTLDSGSSFYHAFRFLDNDQRDAMLALYAFCREVDDIVDAPDTVGDARAKLNHWRRQLRDLEHGNATHPITIALSDARSRYHLPISYFGEIIDGMEMDLNQQSYASFKELTLYCYRVASTVGLLCIEIFGYKHVDTRKYAHDLGIALQLTNILRDVREDALRGRIYIPQDELAEFGADLSQLRGTQSKALRNLFAMQAERAGRFYQSAMQKLPAQDRYSQRVGLVMAAVYQGLLNEIIRRDYAVLESRIQLSKLKKLCIAIGSARSEQRLYKSSHNE